MAIDGGTMERGGNNEKRQTLFSWAPKSLQMVTIKRQLLLGRKALTNLKAH